MDATHTGVFNKHTFVVEALIKIIFVYVYTEDKTLIAML